MNKKKSQLSKSLQLFNLEQVDRDIFSWTGKNVGYKRIFGGQVMAQTLIAAYKTVNSEHFAHSFHKGFTCNQSLSKNKFVIENFIHDSSPVVGITILKPYLLQD